MVLKIVRARRVVFWVAVMGLAASMVQYASAQGPPPLDFQPFAATPDGGVVSDPTIRPMLRPDRSAFIGIQQPIDFQGNGRPDLFLCHNVDAPGAKVPCRVLRPQVDGSLAEVTRQFFGHGALPSVLNASSIVVGDFNGDGRPDVFIAGFGVDVWPFAGETNVLLISNADGTYADRSATLPQAIATAYTACTGDVDGDGNLDIYVGNFTPVGGQPGPYFLMGKGDGTFAQSNDRLPVEIVEMRTGFQAASCKLVDVDQDGHADLVLGIFAPTDSSFVLFNNGTGDFTKRPRYVLPPGPLAAGAHENYNMATLDINRDGRPDILMLSGAIPDYKKFGLQILINRGDGTFADETAARLGGQGASAVGQFGGSLGVADLNGDGWEDLYIAHTNNFDPATPRFWINNGGGTWTGVASNPPLPYKVISGPISAVDFDGDGRTDLLWVAPTDIGDVAYESYQNRAPRTVPSEPFIGNATAGDAQASISFTPPLASGVSPITGYTATCALGTFGIAVKAAGVASPITVSGLANGRTYACSVTATSAAGTSLPSRALSVRPLANPQPPATKPDLNQHGLTGSWYEMATSGQGVEVEVFANPSSGTGSTFVSWFTYDTVGGGAERQRWYTAQGPVVTGQPNAALTIYQNTGGNFNAPPVTNAQAVGTATLSFDTCSSGQMSYSFTDGTGRTGSIPLTRLMQNVTCSTTNAYPTNADFALSGNWFGGAATSGQGITAEVNPNSGLVFAAWYTYMPSGRAAAAAGQRWYTAQGAFTPGMRSIPVTIYQTSGGVFDMPSPPGQNTVVVGTGTMAFQSCSAATFSYNFTGGTSSGSSGVIDLSRVGPVPPGCTP